MSTDSWAVIDSFRFVSPATQGPLHVKEAALTPENDKMYVLARDGMSDALFLFDLNDHSCLFRLPLASNSGFALSPDAREIWVVQGYGYTGHPVPSTLGYVLIVDAQSGAPLDTISTLGLWIDRPDDPFPLGPLVFHPTEPKAYLCSGWPYQSLLVVNTKSREVESILEMGPLHDIAIVPR
jgi:hypothetical protein